MKSRRTSISFWQRQSRRILYMPEQSHQPKQCRWTHHERKWLCTTWWII